MGWTHAVCMKCWSEKNPGQQPVTIVCGRIVERCCFCGNDTAVGIYIRANPATTKHCNHQEDL